MRLLRITTLSPANYGAGAGTASIDRPLALDVWSGLPYVPDSALKGVIADHVAEQPGGQERRSSWFGTGDVADGDSDRRGTPGRVVFGDGELLCFPLRLRTGAAARVFPIAILRKLERLGLTAPWKARAALDERSVSGRVGLEMLPIDPLELRPSSAVAETSVLRDLAGRGTTEMVLAGERVARLLWLRAVEQLDRIALASASKSVAAGQLRTVELVPSGCVFLSLVSGPSAQEIESEELGLLQLGAWEALGCGFSWCEFVDEVSTSTQDAGEAAPDAGLGDGTSHQSPPIEPAAGNSMVQMHQAVQAVVDEKFAKHVPSVVQRFGELWKKNGWSRAIAFYLVRAGYGRSEAKGETRAYRWFLDRLWPAKEPKLTTWSSRLAIVLPPSAVEERWLWLRRYSETYLSGATPST